MGKPSCGNAQLPITEYIGCRRHTRGTETSKYPEEKKTIVIPSVAASESGIAQTKTCPGVVGRLTWSKKRAD